MTGPVIRLRAPTSPPLSSSRWRTLSPEARSPVGWATTERERCPCVADSDRRCMLREAHTGAHAWRSLGGLRIFEWT